MLLERIDPFLAEFDRMSKHVLGSADGGAAMDVIRRGDELVVRFDLPGVAVDAIGVTVENRTLTVAAERHTVYGEGDQLLLQERFDGTVTRRLRIPEWVDGARVDADYVDGVLTVRLPLAEQAKPRKIEVRPGEPARTAIDSGEANTGETS
ncbi:MAG TPA: Hsp20/alpha crystallin family protein [Mycobacteriales bacterium]|jgi:HSP20 family protein|nr:Hsp20/alpha crystallin family protein [Mycobacteriales bacterium]